MNKLDPIIAVRDLAASSEWYCSVFNWKNLHDGDHFRILVADNGEVMLCLHPWQQDEHPTMMNPDIMPGNGLILYFRTSNMAAIRQNISAHGFDVESEVHLNPNSQKMEFSIKDLDGYYLTISEYHTY